MREYKIVDCSTKEESISFLPDLTFEETRTILFQAVKEKQNYILSGGWSHNFGDSIGIHTLDLRDADDKANWTLLMIKTQGMIAAGAGAVPVEIRTAQNVSILIPASDAFTSMQAFLSWGQTVLKRKWVLDTQIAAATTIEELNLIDIESGWSA